MNTLSPFSPAMPVPPQRRNAWPYVAAALLALIVLCAVFPTHAIDLVSFAGVTGPLQSALTQLATLTPGVKALVAFLAFVVALISLAALRSFGPVLSYVGVAIFAAVGLIIGGAIVGAVI